MNAQRITERSDINYEQKNEIKAFWVGTYEFYLIILSRIVSTIKLIALSEFRYVMIEVNRIYAIVRTKISVWEPYYRTRYNNRLGTKPITFR